MANLELIKSELGAIVKTLAVEQDAEIAFQKFFLRWTQLGEKEFVAKWKTNTEGLKYTRAGREPGSPLVDESETFNEVIKKLWTKRELLSPADFVDEGVKFHRAQSIFALQAPPLTPLSHTNLTPEHIRLRIRSHIADALAFRPTFEAATCITRDGCVLYHVSCFVEVILCCFS